MCEQRFEQQKKENKVPVIYGEYGVLLPVMSHEEDLRASEITEGERRYADAVVRLLTHKEELCRYQQAAAERAKDFTYERYLSRMLELISEDSGNDPAGSLW